MGARSLTSGAADPSIGVWVLREAPHSGKAETMSDPVPPPPGADGGAPSTGPNHSAPPPPPPQGQSGALDPKIGAMLSYLLFGWVGGLIMYFTQKHPEVRFHAAQSVIVFGALSIVQIVLSTVGGFGFGAFIVFGLLSTLIGLLSLGLWIYLSIQGYNLNHVKLPVAGDLAEEWAAKPA
jgi:uncharacterized membrane protein